MPNNIDKNLLKNRFEKNLATYSQNAVIQKHMAKELLTNLIKQNNNFDKILEIGCGVGVLTKEISHQLKFNELFVNDIVENSLNPKLRSEKIINLYGDCENIKFPSDLDLIISNATFQWLENFTLFSGKIHTNLKPNGILAFSTFGESNLHQIKTITGKSLNYYKKSKIEEVLNEKFKILYSDSQTLNYEFDTAYSILKHLKLCGVNSLETTKWTKKDLKDFEDKYNKLFKNNNGKLVLTYEPKYFICAKIDF